MSLKCTTILLLVSLVCPNLADIYKRQAQFYQLQPRPETVFDQPQPSAQPAFQPQPPAQPYFQPQPSAQPDFQPQPSAQPDFRPQPPVQPVYQPQPPAQPSLQPLNEELVYQFGYMVDNNIEGNYLKQDEQKSINGKITGQYSYDNGYFFRTVHYEADKHGFRVIKDERIPSKKVGQLNGKVAVTGYFGDKSYQYGFSKDHGSRLVRESFIGI